MREYEVIALRLAVVYNQHGYHDHDGMIFALTENEAELKADAAAKTGQPFHLARPLVLRACVGETVRISLRNEIQGRHVGLHLVGDGYSVITADGAEVGKNPTTLAAYQGTKTYEWRCEREGVFPFHDMGDLDGGEHGSNAHGLFGALIVEPAGAVWTDPVSGAETKDGLYLDVHPRGTSAPLPAAQQVPYFAPEPPKYPADPQASFREYVIFFHDEPDVIPGHLKPEECEAQRDPCEGEHFNSCDLAAHHGRGGPELPDHVLEELHCAGVHPGHGAMVMPISYRAEPMPAREALLWKRFNKGDFPNPNIVNEEQHHSSWAFGEPATPVLKAYLGDPVRIRLVHAGVKETHVFHLHFYQWHHIPGNARTPILDSLTISPQTGHTIVPLFGAGGRQGAPGDVIWHCHLYPHFHQGMWGMFRTFDLRHDGTTGAQPEGDFSNHYPDGMAIEKLVPLPDREPPPAAIKDDPGYPGFMVDERGAAVRKDVDRAGVFGEKSPRPPWPVAHFGPMPPELDYRPARAAEIVQIFRFHRLSTAPTAADQTRYAGVIARLAAGEQRFNSAPQPAWMLCSYMPSNPDGTPITALDRRFDDLAVVSEKFIYNRHLWHDDFGHRYTLLDDAPRARSVETHAQTAAHDDGGEGGYPGHTHEDEMNARTVPLFIRAQVGEVVGLTLENKLPREFPCTDFDVRQPRCVGVCPPAPQDCLPSECGLHVHLVKFDVATADGAATGWNYISGPRVGKKMIYRWWVDEEFGTCFFHDHLFANFRQRHGLFSALIAEPKGSKFLDPWNHAQELRSGIEAVIIPAHEPAFREFCFGLHDFIPLFTRAHDPLHKPAFPGAHGDQGWMGMNYRCEPIRERRIPSAALPDEWEGPGPVGDPAFWFSTLPHQETVHFRGKPVLTKLFAHPAPSTDVFETYVGDAIRIRLVQGAHEEQHSFQIHGMRWRRFRDEPASPLQNQQTLGLSEAFTFNLAHGGDDPAGSYGAGDHLWKSAGADDLWCGVWGYIRALAPAGAGKQSLVALPPFAAPAAAQPGLLPPTPATTRRFRLEAREERLDYRESDLVDPFGLVYRLTASAEPGRDFVRLPAAPVTEPLVLRCRAGEWVEVTLTNNIASSEFPPEPHAPQVPEDLGVDRPVSLHVSMHADLLRYDMHTSDGANVGANLLQTVAPGSSVTYQWFADRELGPVLLQDVADFLHHRRHGLIGALIVEPANATPHRVAPEAVTAAPGAAPAWHGPRATLRAKGQPDFEEIVLLMQDGVRLYLNGHPSFPIPDVPADPGEEAPDFEDQGQKAFNYHAEPIGPPDWLNLDTPATPIFYGKAGAPIRVRLIGACDKPRNHSFTVHAHVWPEWPGVPGTPYIACMSGVTSGSVFTLELENSTPAAGDHAYRGGIFKWDASQGLWGILRLA
jgi:FtsP/CotA-like multicopper oxidase with cupredoxin domain